MTRGRLRPWIPALVGLVLALGSIIVASAIGPSSVGPADVWAVVLNKLGLASHRDVSPIMQAIVWDLRMPRTVLAALVGAGLAVAGAVMQAVTRNPLADPYLLGLSSGAALGAVVVLVLGVAAGSLGVAGGAFIGALVAFGFVIAIAVSGRRLDPAVTVLAGVAVGTICAALTSLIVVVAANPFKTREVDYWLLGSLAGTTWGNDLVAAPVVVACVGVCIGCARSLNAMAFGDSDARALGVDTTRLRWILLVTCALMTGVLVSLSGAIGFVGLLLPHAARMIVGRDNRRLLPVSALAGAIFLVWADTVARTALQPREIPVGVVTALVGAPAFALLIRQRRRAP
ncbi:MAG TPA: iron chelate uptake ABC transporter family permease subunit [Solirubrobacterales bacterium]|nr:iron chelate uptake ABC transporter family permease subunit [Solirubrobacterales bacterium]